MTSNDIMAVASIPISSLAGALSLFTVKTVQKTAARQMKSWDDQTLKSVLTGKRSSLKRLARKEVVTRFVEKTV